MGGFWDSVVGAGERVLGVGAEVGAHALEAIPGVGAIPAIMSGAVHSNRAADARLDARLHADDPERVARDRLTESYNDGQSKADFVHAIPLLGTGLDVAELIHGAVSGVVPGGADFHEGMERARDTEIDVMDWITGTDSSYASREAQRHAYERQEGH
jgi:hypothetical protein